MLVRPSIRSPRRVATTTAVLALAALGLDCRGQPRPDDLAARSPRPPRAPAQAEAIGATSLAPGHPRLWLTAADLPRLRAWARAGDPLWSRALAARLAEYDKAYDERFFPAGRAADPWPDKGGISLEQTPTEDYAALFAFASLVEPSEAARAGHAARARRLLMHVIDLAALGDADAPFRHERFAFKDRSRWQGEYFALTVDWIYPALGREDRAKIRNVFARWCGRRIDAFAHRRHKGMKNDPRLVADRRAARWAGNNFFASAARNCALEAMAIDPADDPAGLLRATFDETVGGFLYQQWNLFGPGGDASGGLPPEGAFFYGAEGTSFLAQEMLGLQTAGKTRPEELGEPIRLVGDVWWSELVEDTAHAIAPAPEILPGLEWLGPAYRASIIEQTQHQYFNQNQLPELAPVALVARARGDARTDARVRWLLSDAMPGGRAKLADRARGDTAGAILSFLLFDPAAPPAPDFRPELPTSRWVPSERRLFARTDWGPSATWFNATCNWKQIDHQIEHCGAFGLWRRGEWITKPRGGYSSSGIIDTPDYWNALGLENDPVEPGFWEAEVIRRGGPVGQGLSEGDPSAVVSLNDSFAYFEADATPLFNRVYEGVRALDILQASRAIVWLVPDAVVTYDRATSKTAGRFKRWSLVLPGAPAVAGHVVTAETPKGQVLRVDTLLPAAAVVTREPWENDALLAPPEAMVARVRVEDPARPADVRFLHALQVADPGGAPRPATLLEPTGPVPFHGAVVGAAAVLFPIAKPPSAPPALDWSEPASVRLHVVTGLAPGARYDASMRATGDVVHVALRRGGALAADAGGALHFGR
jgi:hypothetical protein